MVKDLIIKPYNPTNEKNWLKCRLLSFYDSAYYDDVYTSKPIFNNLSLELVAELNGEIIGILDLEKDNNEGSICYCKSGIGAMVWTISVLPEYRRFGIASKLVLKAMDWAKNKNIDFIVATHIFTIEEHAALAALKLNNRTKSVYIHHGADAFEAKNREKN